MTSDEKDAEILKWKERCKQLQNVLADMGCTDERFMSVALKTHIEEIREIDRKLDAYEKLQREEE